VDVHYPAAEKIRLVLDNLNTHSGASLYEAFPPDEARRLLDRLEVHPTPKHGSWLDMAEIELRIMNRQCLDRRIDEADVVRREVGTWEADSECAGLPDPLDIQPRRRSAETEETLPVNRRLTGH
jgi:hypothetical protein